MKLSAITANRHVLGGRRNGRPLHLLLTFDAGQKLRLGVAGDGSRMIVDSQPLDQPFDMGEYGSVVVEDETRSFSRVQNAEVSEVRSLKLEDQQVGVRLLLSSGDAIDFWIDGDELFWGDENALAAHDWPNGFVPTACGRIPV